MTTNLLARVLQQGVQTASPEVLKDKLSVLADTIGDEAFCKLIAREAVVRTQPQQAIPDVYGRYRTVVRDGIEFFLSQVSRQRLMELVISQLQLDPLADSRQRLLELAKRFPTLHKLGQIIARNPNIDSAVKKWLVQLENGRYGTPLNGVRKRIRRQLERTGNRKQVKVRPAILAEASVGAVVAFDWNQPSSQNRLDGIFKILKPGIQRHLDEELVILEKTAAFFEKNREHYAFKNFRFLDVFQEVRERLIKEIDLAAEQTYLKEANRFYAAMEIIQVPQVYHLSTDTMTAMEYLDGAKITDAPLNQEARKRCAAILFEALVCRPLFSQSEPSLFHGDPHAGNILAVNHQGSGQLRIGLLDWTLAGHLTKRDRIKTIQLIQAILKKDLSGIRRSIKALANGSFMDSPGERRDFRRLVLSFMRSPEFAGLTLIKRAFKLLEQLAFEGYTFPADLMLFRKAIFTLDGVLYDLWPSFDKDAAIMLYLTGLILKEIPGRFLNLFFPFADRPENYPSLISNGELQSLLVHRYFAAINTGT